MRICRGDLPSPIRVFPATEKKGGGTNLTNYTTNPQGNVMTLTTNIRERKSTIVHKKKLIK